MTLLQRIGYYLGGFSIGLVILAFFLNGKKVSCDYSAEARTLKNINTKQIVYSDDINVAISKNALDSLTISYLLKHGHVNFDERARQKPCGIYAIEGEYKDKEILMTVQNCDSIATILNISPLSDD